MDKATDRRKGFKTPPVDPKRSQDVRRAEALQEQKRRRAQHIDATRQLDRFAGLSLGVSSDEDEPELQQESNAVPGLANDSPHPASLLLATDADYPPASRSPSPYLGENVNSMKKKRRRKRGKKKPSDWANKCMYAELLEMREDTLSTNSWDIGRAPLRDGIPEDLETAWVGLGPLPVGKRCLAVTMQGTSINWKGSNTTLRSRLMGKVLLHPFPSPLPPNTILDCILDENWRTNGILHVLDVIRWKSQDVSSCEANFRFWWRDTRLAEIESFPYPNPHKSTFQQGNDAAASYRFPYPTTLVPIPYVKPDSLQLFLSDLIPRARSSRTFSLKLPTLTDAHAVNGEEMQIDFTSGQEDLLTAAGIQIEDKDVTIRSDGLLLYVGEASYESGESPLSVWLPCKPIERFGCEGREAEVTPNPESTGESPLDVFERLVRRRLLLREGGHTIGGVEGVEIDME